MKTNQLGIFQKWPKSDIIFPKNFTAVSECFVKATHFQKSFKSATLKIWASCPLKNIEFIACLICFASRRVGAARNTGLGLNIWCSFFIRIWCYSFLQTVVTGNRCSSLKCLLRCWTNIQHIVSIPIHFLKRWRKLGKTSQPCKRVFQRKIGLSKIR